MKAEEFKELIREEDAGISVVPTNSAGSGGIDGVGIGKNGEPGVKRKKLSDIIKRKRILPKQH